MNVVLRLNGFTTIMCLSGLPLLQGGVIGCIAKEYLSIDGVLAGPSLEVTAHRVGYLGYSGDANLLYCDDELTENEIAAICVDSKPVSLGC